MSITSTHLQQDKSDTVTQRILAVIAEQEGVDPLDFDRQLYDVIDPDALGALFQPGAMNGRVTFTYLGYEVAVDSDGGITLTPVDE